MRLAIDARARRVGDRPPTPVEPIASQPRRWMFLAVVAGAVALHALVSRTTFPFSDDYLFLGQAREGSWTWSYLAKPLFTHFSPISRALNLLMVDVLPGHPAAIWVMLIVLMAAVVLSTAALMIVLFGWSWPALAGLLVLAPTLSLLPLETWYIAGVNILPALAGATLTLAGVVAVVSGRSRWWGAVSILGYGIAVLDWEITMLAAGYAAGWLLLFRRRVTDETLLQVLRRTWWLWSLLILIGATALWNYRVNYYEPTPPAGIVEVLRALSIALFDTVVPSLLGFHDPTSSWFVVIGTGLGVLALGWVMAYTLIRRVGAWRGWVYGVAGWLAPSAALVLNRVWMWGPNVSEYVMYFYLPSMLLMVGVLEAWSAPASKRLWMGPILDRRPGRGVIVVAVVLVASGYAWSARATIAQTLHFGYQATYGAADPAFVGTFEASADAAGAGGAKYSVINADAPTSLVAPPFFPYNRLDKVIAVSDPAISFDAVDGPYYVAGPSGALHPAEIRWEQQLTVSGPSAAPQFSGVLDVVFGPAGGVCFTPVDGESKIVWQLDQPVDGAQLVVRSLAMADGPTDKRVLVSPGNDLDYTAANYDAGKQWRPDRAGVLDTVAHSPISTVVIDSMTAGVRICLDSLAVGSVHLSD